MKPSQLRTVILGTGSELPSKVMSNLDLEKLVETTDEWITTRTGIKERRILEEGKGNADMAYAASVRALKDAGIEASDLDAIIMGTVTPDYPFPSSACVLEDMLGARGVFSFDVNAACSGFLNALSVADAFIRAGRIQKALVVGSDALSRLLNWKDRGTCILFGDAAGAVVLGPSDGESDILYSKMGCDGREAELIITYAGGTAMPITPEALEKNLHTIHMKGREVYKFAVPKFVEIIRTALRETDLDLSEIDHFVPHQMNMRMIEAVAERLSFPREKIVINIENYGNTSAASIPLALDESVRSGRIKRGDLLLMSAMGAGITWGTVILRW